MYIVVRERELRHLQKCPGYELPMSPHPLRISDEVRHARHDFIRGCMGGESRSVGRNGTLETPHLLITAEAIKNEVSRIVLDMRMPANVLLREVNIANSMQVEMKDSLSAEPTELRKLLP